MMAHRQQHCLCYPPPPLPACALANGGACVRIKLRFDDHKTILTQQQHHDGLRQCLFLVRPAFQYISDLESDIVATFHLLKACPDGISLSIDGFTLPRSQPTYVLKDDEVVSVRKRKYQGKLTSSTEVKLKSSLSIDDTDNIGGDTTLHLGEVKLLAIDGFEGEGKVGGVGLLVDGRIATGAQSKASLGGSRSLKKKRGIKQIDNAAGKGNVKNFEDVKDKMHVTQLMQAGIDLPNDGNLQKTKVTVEDNIQDDTTVGIDKVIKLKKVKKAKMASRDPPDDKILKKRKETGRSPPNGKSLKKRKVTVEDNIQEVATVVKDKGIKLKKSKKINDEGRELPNDENLKKTKVTLGDNFQEDATVVIDKAIKSKKAKKIKKTGRDPQNYENLKRGKGTVRDDIQEDVTVVIDKVIKLKKDKKLKETGRGLLTNENLRREGAVGDNTQEDAPVVIDRVIKSKEAKKIQERERDPSNYEKLKRRKVTVGDNIQEDATVVIDKVVQLKNSKKVETHSSLNLVQNEDERELRLDETTKKKKLGITMIKKANEALENTQKKILNSETVAGKENHDVIQEARKSLKSIEDQVVLEANKGKQIDCREPESTRKPSRSALRKRAKRRWKREHAKILREEENEPICRSSALKKQADARETESGQQKNQPENGEDDNEAEEERLPLVLRPGHIRFEPLDEDEGHNSVQGSMLRISWNYPINKRQGHSWGQEKTMEKIFGKETKMTLDIEATQNGQSVEPGKISFESLPSLTNTPQVGDIIAYRLVELTSSMCPELSDYRVGQVAVFESGPKQIKLNALPNYPINQDLTGKEQEIESLYNEDGSLEADFMSLVDVRLVQQGDVHEFKTSEAQNDPFIPTEVNFSASSLAIRSDSAADLSSEVQKKENMNKVMDMISEETTNSISSVVEFNPSRQVIGQGVDTNFALALQELSQMLDKRKEELSQATGFGSIQNSCKHSEMSKARGDEKSGSVANASGGKAFNGRGKSLSYRTIRAGALGPIMTILREQNAL